MLVAGNSVCGRTAVPSGRNFCGVILNPVFLRKFDVVTTTVRSFSYACGCRRVFFKSFVSTMQSVEKKRYSTHFCVEKAGIGFINVTSTQLLRRYVAK